MTDLAELVQGTSLRSLGTNPEPHLERLRPALRQLREDYKAGRAPDFADPLVRQAYILSYHPHHCVLSAAVLGAAGNELLGLAGRSSAVVAVLGAGPAAEFVGLTWFLEREVPTLRHVDLHLIDREAGWVDERSSTIDATIRHWWTGTHGIVHHTVDLAEGPGLQSVAHLLHAADLVIAQAVLTEIPDPLGDGQLVDHLLRTFGSRTRLMVTDFRRAPGFRGVNDRLDTARDGVVLADARFDIPAARPLPPVASHLLDGSARGLIPRRKLHCSMRVLGRPGSSAERSPSSPELIELTSDQRAALESFDKFLGGPDRVFILRGGAGTGKTSLVRALASAAAARQLRVELLAPTGQAVRRVARSSGRPACTIHSRLYRFDRNESISDQEAPPTSRFVPKDPPEFRAVYIVDEASLIGDIPDTVSERRRAEVTFGDGLLLSDLMAFALAAPGSKLCIVGDPDQLPPVGEDTAPALHSEEMATRIGSEPVTADLHQVVRHAEAPTLLRVARESLDTRGGLTPTMLDPAAGVASLARRQLPSWLHRDVIAGDAVVIAARNLDVRDWNYRIRAAAERPTEQPVVGDRLLLTRTDPLTALLNGADLQVVEVDPDVIEIKLRDDIVRLRRVAVRSEEIGVGEITTEALIVEDLLLGASWEDRHRTSRLLHVDFIRRTGLRPGHPEFTDQYRRDERTNALRATYGYARTCHRAQGSEWDDVVVDLAGIRALGPLAGRWTYTAITRARRAVHLVHAPRPASLGPDALITAATQELLAAGLHVVGTRTIQGGVQLSVGDEKSHARINLYTRGGVPSSAVKTGRPSKDPALDDMAVRALRDWIATESAAATPELPPRLDELAGNIATDLLADGYDIEVRHRADYEVEFTIDSPTASASLIYNYSLKDGGTLTRERSASADRNLDLLRLLRETIGRHST